MAISLPIFLLALVSLELCLGSPLTRFPVNLPTMLTSKESKISALDTANIVHLMSNQNFSFNADTCALAHLTCIPPYEIVVNPALVEKDHYLTRSHLAGYDRNSFFPISLLKPNQTMHLVDMRNPFPARSFLPDPVASRVKITRSHLNTLFPSLFTSPFTKDAAEATLLFCDTPHPKGDANICARSLTEMLSFAARFSGRQMTAVASQNGNGSGKTWRVEKVRKMKAENQVVPCHEVYLPFSVFMCHVQPKSEIYEMKFVDPETNVELDNTVMAVCHLDTSKWSPDLVLFKILGTSPGKTPICHFLTENDVVFI